MPRDGAGTYSLPQSPFQPNTVISSATVNSNFSDIATGLTGSLASNGETVPTANLPMGGFKHTGVATATARTQYATAGQVQDAALIYAGASGGTSSAITATITPGVSAYVDGMEIQFRATTTCAANPTFNLNALGAKKIYALTPSPTQAAAGDISSGGTYKLIYSTTLDSSAGGWVLVGAGASGALAGRATAVYMTGAQTIPDGSNTTLSWSTTEVDTLGAWSGGAPSRLTVPSGVSLVLITAGTRWSYTGSSGQIVVSITKNGSLARGKDTRKTADGTEACLSRIDSCVAGDYYELQALQTTGGAVDFVGSGDGAFAMTVLR